MHAVARSSGRVPAASAERPYSAVNQRRADEALQMLGALAARIVSDPNPSLYLLDLASQDGTLQAVWCRDGSSGFVPPTTEPDAAAISAGLFGPVNAERFARAQKALSSLLLELTRPGCNGSATLRIRGAGGELSDEIRGESHRQWLF